MYLLFIVLVYKLRIKMFFVNIIKKQVSVKSTLSLVAVLH